MNTLDVIESKLRGDIAQAEELLGTAVQHNTPFVNTITLKLEESRKRLDQLIDLRNREHSEQEIEAFLTTSEKEAFDFMDRILDPERLRINLLLVSLYLTAFEVLANSIVQRIEDFFIPSYLKEYDDTQQLQARKDDYEREVGKKFSVSPNYKFEPSCRWLRKNGVLSDDEVIEIIEIRNHRHDLAHNLPSLILSDVDLVVNLKQFTRIKELVKKVQLFWIRMDMDIQGIGEDVSDEDISGGWDTLDLIISTVLDYTVRGAQSSTLSAKEKP